jgi:hypothetical protein
MDLRYRAEVTPFAGEKINPAFSVTIWQEWSFLFIFYNKEYHAA